MKKYNPVSGYQEFLNEQNMEVKSNPSTPLLNFLISNGFSMEVHPISNARFGKKCEDIRIGHDWNKLNAFMVTILPVWTEYTLEDNYGEDWKNEDVPEVGTIMKGYGELSFNFFTNSPHSNSPQLQEEALRYAQSFYRLYQKYEIKAEDRLDLMINDNLDKFLNETGVNIKSNKDTLLLHTICYRAYQDNKCIFDADEFFKHTDFLINFLHI